NLLTVILGNLEFLREDPHSAERDAFVDEAMRATERGRALTRQLLAFGRRAPLEPERVDIAGVLGETQRVLARVLPTAVTLDLSPPHALMAVRIDRNQLENALLNLVLNARDAMPEGGRISLSAANTVIGPEEVQIPGAHAGEGPDERLMPGSYVVVEVSDTGHGMDEETLARAFEPFFTTKEVGEGSGLGLSMVFGFARQSGGSARIASRPGAGTTVWLYFPAIEAASVPSPGGDRHAGPADAARAAGGGMAPLRVLLAEDDEAVRRVVAAHLRAAGHAVTVAENGDRAMAILARTPAFDLLVSDVVMPGRAQGPDLASMALKALPSLRIVFLSGYPQGQRSGAHEMLHRHPVLQKPVAAAELAATIDTVMATRRAA
ncbi:MAG: ATP-binding protein, partial [Pseudomonadota bacterium]